MRTITLALALLFPAAAFAADQSSSCAPVAPIKARFAENGGRWVDLTPEQWTFMRGMFVANPTTPAGLPFGDRAALAQHPHSKDGAVFFIDGDKACTPLSVPSALVDLLVDVATGQITHETPQGSPM